MRANERAPRRLSSWRDNIPLRRLIVVVKLLLYKACWRTVDGTQAQCNTFTLAQALAAAIEARVDVINLSLAGPSDPLLTRLVLRALNGGAIVVGAVPLDGLRNDFPANIPNVIAVDAVENSGAV